MFSRQRPNRRSLFSFVVIVFLIICGTLALARPSFLTEGVMRFAVPLLAVRATANDGARVFPSAINSKQDLIAENSALKEEVERLRVEALSYESMRAAYDELLASVGGAESFDGTLARVLAAPSVLPYDTLLTDVGNEHGVVKGDVVLSTAATVLGVVEETTSKTSTIVLISSPGREENVRLASEGFLTKSVGHGGGAFLMRVPKDVSVVEGDVVELAMAPGIVAGFVRDVRSTDVDSFQTIVAALPVNLYTIRNVIISPGYTYDD